MPLHGCVLWWVNNCGMRLYGGGKNTPPAPDYTGAAQAQAASSQAAQTAADYANRPTVNTPFGQETWAPTTTTDPTTGKQVTSWTENVNLTPDEQSALNAQQAIQSGQSQAAEQLLGRATTAISTPVDYGDLPAAPTDIGQAQEQAYNIMSQSLQPARGYQQESLETQLANQGIPQGSDAWNKAHSQLQAQWTQEDNSLLAQAQGQGISDAQAQEALRQSAIGEQTTAQELPLNELNALLTGQQVQSPQTAMNAPAAQAAQGANLFGAAQAQGQFGLAQQQAAQTAGTDWGTIGAGVASAALIAV